MISFNAINAEITWTLSDGTLTISGTGEMPNYSLVNQNQPWSSKKSTIKKVIIENGVTNIGKYTFYNYSNLTTITIPKSVTSIGGFAFAYCKSLTSITIPNSVTSIGGGAFNGCGLTSITIPNSVTTIDDYTFYDCKDLTSITIPNSVTKIGEMAFCGCSALTSITIPKSVTNINIGSGIFSKCSSLNSITVEKGNTKYDSRDDCNAIIETKTNTLIASCNNTIIPNSVTTIGSFAFGDSNRTSITIPATITDIRIRAFCGCSDLTFVTVEEGNTIYDSREKCNAIIETKSNSLIVGCRNTVIPSSVTSISNWAFEWCKSLTSISIPNSVTSIGINAFSGCLGLTSISIPNSVTSIGINAFSYCSGLTSITCEAITPPDCGSSCFYDINKSIPVYVAANNVDAYKTANLWKDFTNIQAIPTTYTLTDGELYNIGSQRKECEISYTRTFNNTAWQALYIPFSLNYNDWKDNFEIAYINGVRQLDKNDDGIIDETIMDVIKIKSGSTSPNMPYLIKAKTTGEKTFSVSNATLYPAEENSVDCSTTIAKYTFTGTYNAIPSATMIANGYYAMGGGDLIQSDGSNDLKPYRWYMKVESRNPSYNASNAAKTITINVIDEEGETTTGVEELQMTNYKSPVYDLNGRKVNENNLKPGIYVKNGKKFIVK